MKDKLWIVASLLLCGQWILLRTLGTHPHSPWDALLPGLAIVGAAFILSWAAEVAQLDIPQALAVSMLALVALLPEYAVDIYFAWMGGKDPAYVPYATANMTGANRLLIGFGWPVILLAHWFKSKKQEIHLEKSSAMEFQALLLATLYAFLIPIKGHLSWVDGVVLLAIFAFYSYRIAHAEVVEPELEGPAQLIARLNVFWRRAVAIALFVLAGLTIYLSAEPFAEGLLHAGRTFGIEEFLLVQWLAPLASESPEFIVAILFALKGIPHISLRTLVSSKVNQWTLLVGLLPFAYNLSAGSLHPMHLDARQVEEIFLTAAQSFFGLAVLMNFSFSIKEAGALFALFTTQLFFTDPTSRYIFSGIYLTLTLGMLIFQKGRLSHTLQVLLRGRST